VWELAQEVYPEPKHQNNVGGVRDRSVTMATALLLLLVGDAPNSSCRQRMVISGGGGLRSRKMAPPTPSQLLCRVRCLS
jgi:hypothetical protein